MGKDSYDPPVFYQEDVSSEVDEALATQINQMQMQTQQLLLLQQQAAANTPEITVPEQIDSGEEIDWDSVIEDLQSEAESETAAEQTWLGRASGTLLTSPLLEEEDIVFLENLLSGE